MLNVDIHNPQCSLGFGAPKGPPPFPQTQALQMEAVSLILTASVGLHFYFQPYKAAVHGCVSFGFAGFFGICGLQAFLGCLGCMEFIGFTGFTGHRVQGRLPKPSEAYCKRVQGLWSSGSLSWVGIGVLRVQGRAG